MIKIEHLVKNYGTLCALDDVNIEIGKGEVVGLLGPNGAGKSTMMNILTGYMSCTSGSVSVDGADIADNPMDAKKKIGYLPEVPPVYPDMTVAEYLDFVYDLKCCRLDRKTHISEILTSLKIADVKDRLIKNLSKGYRQRVGIAQALVGDPELIIFDEPTVGLDPKQIIEVRTLIRTLGKKHTVILSTHILQEVQAVCDRIIIINKGKIVADEKAENIARAVSNSRKINARICGPAKEVVSAVRAIPGVANAEQLIAKDTDAVTLMIECDPGVDIRKPLFFEMAKCRYPIIGLESAGMSLEEVFIAVVDNRTGEDGGKKNSKRQSRRSAEAEFARSIMKNAGSGEIKE